MGVSLDDHPIHDLLRKRLRGVREKRHLTQKEIAERADLPVSSYNAIETGAVRMTILSLWKILSAIGVPIWEIWPPNLEQSSNLGEATEFSSVDQITAFRFLDIFSFCGADGAVLIFRKAHHVEVLCWINAEEDERQCLCSENLLNREPPGWKMLTKKKGLYSIYLYLKNPNPEAIGIIEPVASTRLSQWLATKRYDIPSIQ